MPLTSQNYENFFLGTAAEYRIASEVYFHGLEANKFTPDFGVDLIVTNAAQVHLKGASPFTHHLQVKATFVVQSCATFYLGDDELRMLLAQPDLSCVFCCVIPCIEAHPQSFERGDFEPWRPALDAELDQRAYDAHFNALRQQHGCLSAIDFKGSDFCYFWLNTRQLQRSVDEGCWAAAPSIAVAMRMRATLKDDTMRLASTQGECVQLVREVQNLYYLLKLNASSAKLAAGAFALEHY